MQLKVRDVNRFLLFREDVIARGEDNAVLNLKELAGRRIKRRLVKNPDGSVVVFLDDGEGKRGLMVRFSTVEDFVKCRQEGPV